MTPEEESIMQQVFNKVYPPSPSKQISLTNQEAEMWRKQLYTDKSVRVKRSDDAKFWTFWRRASWMAAAIGWPMYFIVNIFLK